jgi:hypothetical protein
MGLLDGSGARGDRKALQYPTRIGDRNWLAGFIVLQLAYDDEVILELDGRKHYRAALDAQQGLATVVADDGPTHVWQGL